MPAVKKTAQQVEGEKVDALIDAVTVPKKREQTITAGPDSPYFGFTKTYTQQKLSFFGKLEFLRLASTALNKAMGSENGDTLDLAALTAGMNGGATQAEMFIRAISRLAEFAPGIVKDIYLISLNVPKGSERDVVEAIFDEPYDEETNTGGLSDEDGFAILNTFVAQNGRVMRDFYLDEMPKVGKALQEAMSDPTSTSAASKPSKPSARSTR